MKAKTKKQQEAAERQQENLDALRQGFAAAQKLFRTERPTLEMALGTAQVLGDVNPTVYPALLQEAADYIQKYGLSVENGIYILDVVLHDDEYEAHIATAIAQAEAMFGPDIKDTLVEVYDIIYGTEPEDESE